jgi:hypothetical protein
MFISSLLMLSCITILNAENNESNKSTDTKASKIEKQLQEQMKQEQKFAEEQTFYKGEDYDLSYAEVNKDSLDDIPLIEPDYDFDMDDVYD